MRTEHGACERDLVLLTGATLLCLAACGGSSEQVALDVDAATDDKAVTEIRSGEQVGADLREAAPEEIPPELRLVDLFESADSAGEAEAGCPPGGGCFLDPCDGNSDCLEGPCVSHMGNLVCSLFCVEECPEGWQCTQVGAPPDVLYACVSPFTHLCRPCGDSNDCKAPTGVEDVCVSYGPQGSFCGADCSGGQACPAGFSCQSVLTTEGGEVEQCHPDSGLCECSDTAIKLGLITPCFEENEFGKCPGQRQCTEDGLSGCSAQIPHEEICGMVDDDCDGLTDEDEEAICDDQDPCTQDSCDSLLGVCLDSPLTGPACDDFAGCTEGDFCQDGVCVGVPIVCDDGNLCTDDSCNEKSLCTFTDNFLPCDDQDPCTLGDACAQGSCQGVGIPCQCQEDADCLVLEDGDLCNGWLFCDKEAFPQVCAVVEGSVVLCPAPEGLDAPCLAAHCDPGSGECSFVPAHEGLACDDDNACSLGDQCDEGACAGKLEANCNDGNPCTDDYCEALLGCLHADNALPCSDGDVCTTGDTCAQGSCKSGTDSLSCDDGNLCTDDSCAPTQGCVHLANALPCDDGNACTTVDVCDSGWCLGKGTLPCDDKNVCTTDSCDPGLGCTHEPNALPCDDGNACTVLESCLDGACTGGKLPNCNDGNPCTDDSCDPGLGCLHVVNNAACNDGDVCTTLDLCKDGLCLGAVPLECDDGNMCTDDSCAPASGCAHTPNSLACDDANACTTQDKCAGGLCHGQAMLDCDDGNPCTKDSCVKTAGCLNEPLSGPCSDGDVCTLGDSCQGGLCIGQGKLECDDGNPCTDDSCDPTEACLHADNSVPCDDGDACTTDDACAGGQCAGQGQLSCDDQKLCTDKTCSPAVGCVFSNNALACDDEDPCTDGDLCEDGECSPGPPLTCNDQDPCTDDWCEAGVGCQTTPNAADCEDGDPCTTGDKCTGGACMPGQKKDCSDANPCTVDTCTPAGCEHKWSGPCTVQPGPEQGMDHVIGSVYNIDPNGTMDHIRTGGWGDNYWALLQFPLETLPPSAAKATIWLFGMNDNINPTQMYLDRVTSPWAENCSWGGKPSTTNLTSIPPSSVGVWYSIEITELYNGWKSAAYPNYGIMLRSHGTWNNYNGFWSSDYTDDPTLRPKLVVDAK
jgi:hypothetical protein